MRTVVYSGGLWSRHWTKEAFIGGVMFQPAFILKSSQVFQEVMKQILKVLKHNKADGNSKFNGKFWGSAALRP